MSRFSVLYSFPGTESSVQCRRGLNSNWSYIWTALKPLVWPGWFSPVVWWTWHSLIEVVGGKGFLEIGQEQDCPSYSLCTASCATKLNCELLINCNKSWEAVWGGHCPDICGKWTLVWVPSEVNSELWEISTGCVLRLMFLHIQLCSVAWSELQPSSFCVLYESGHHQAFCAIWVWRREEKSSALINMVGNDFF